MVLLRLATIDDTQRIFKWRNHPWIVSLSSSQQTVTWEEHIDWFESVVSGEKHLIWVIEVSVSVSAGIVRIDKIDDKRGAITIYLLPELTGQGLGAKVITEACNFAFIQFSLTTVHAYIRHENYPSISAFTKAGFIKKQSENCPLNHIEMVLEKV
jgi:RimJ/RimL family protein N-acetyltransferase